MKRTFKTLLLRIFAIVVLAGFAPIAGAVVCQFIPVSGQWDLPGNWANCTGGNGVPANTPGPADRAEVTGKTAILPAGSFSVGDVYLGAAVIQGAGMANSTLNVVAAGTIAWGSGAYTFQNLTVVFTSTSTIPAASGPLTVDNSQLILTPPLTTMLADSITISGAGAKITNGGIFNPSTFLTMTAGGTFENDPSAAFTPVSPIVIDGSFTNKGAFLTSSAAPISLTNAAAFSQTAVSGYIGGNGTISSPGQVLTIASGYVEGDVSISVGTLDSVGATFSPGGVNTVGTINISGNLNVGAGTAFDIEIQEFSPTPTFDRVNVAGTVNFFGGAFNIFYIGGYIPFETDTFNAITHGGFTGGPSSTSHGGNNDVFTNLLPNAVQFVIGPAASTVTNTNDAGPGSLRQAIADLNTCDVSNLEIRFNISGTISPLSPLPPIACPMKIRGYSQPGSSPNSAVTDWNAVLGVTLDGSLCSACTGLVIQREDVEVEGINFTNWDTGIRINPQIGPESPGHNAKIKGNYFFQGAVGVSHEGGDNVLIGGGSNADRNVFVHATQTGIQSLGHTGLPGLNIHNNLIGAGAAMAAGPNAKGVFINGSNHIVGQQNRIVNNGKGVVILSGSNNDFVANNIYDNTIIGVDLGDNGPTANDILDVDLGPNGLVNFPVITSANVVGGDLVVNFSVDTTLLTDFNVYACSTSPPGPQSQCQNFLGGTSGSIGAVPGSTGTFTVPAANLASFGVVFPADITLFTQISSGLDAGSTSEFSPSVLVAAAGAPAISVTGTTSFPNTAVGSSAAVQTITITNTGTSNLSISSITNSNVPVFKDTVNGPPPQPAHYCGFGSDIAGAPLAGGPIVIAPMATCNLVMVFGPNAAGPLSGTITINSDAPTSPTIITLTGTGVVAPTATLTPDPMNFGNVTVGATSAPLTATFANPSGTLLQISSINVGPGFTVTGGTCSIGGMVASAGGNCTITLTATPAAPGTASSALQVFTTPLSNNPSVIVSVTGLVPVPVISSPATASGVVGSPFTYQIIASNSPVSYGATGLPAGLGINAGTGQISGTPSAAGTFAATINATNGSGTGSQGLSITISAAPVPSMTVSFAPGSVSTGVNSTMTLTLTNPDISPAFISSGSVTIPAGLNATPPGSNSCGTFGSVGAGVYSFGMGTIPALGSCTIDLTVQSATAGTYTVTINPGALTAGIGNNANTSSAALTVTGAAPLVSSSPPASGNIGTPYNHTFTATGSPTIVWSIATGTVPPGLVLNAAGVLSGTPTAAGTFSFTVQAANGVLPNATQFVSLVIAPAAAPAVSLSSASIPFGARTVNTTSPVTSVTLTNSGTAGLVIFSITSSGDFGFTTTCPLSTPPINPAGTCTINITFTPLTVAALTGNITITSTAPGSPHVIALSGTGSAVAIPGISVSTATLNFGSQPLNSASGARSIAIGNTGFATLLISGITKTGSGDFTRVNVGSASPDCAGSVAPTGTCFISVIYTPSVLGAATAQISIASNAAGSPHIITLSGSGIAAAIPAISVAGSVAFGDQVIATSSTQTLTVTSASSAPLTISGITLGGTDAGSFAINSRSCTVIAAGASCVIEITFTPTSVGAKSAQLVINSDASGQSVTTVTLTGNGILAPRPEVSLSSTAIGYGNAIFGGATAGQVVTLRNTGGLPLSIQNLYTVGDFVQMSSCGASVASGASCVINVLFSPLAIGNRSGELVLESNAAGSPHRIVLNGTGCRWFSQAQSRLFITVCGN